MISERELIEAIRECENSPTSFQNCERLSVFYTVYDHLYGKSDGIKDESSQDSPSKQEVGEIEKEIIFVPEATSDFLRAVKGIDANYFWKVMDELISTIEVINPRLYEGLMKRLEM